MNPTEDTASYFCDCNAEQAASADDAEEKEDYCERCQSYTIWHLVVDE